ncbi:hypothetical protein F5880DRAFT_1542850 [Lentinula raphanica]|nr:hypothetical protein F5880DRAFT_1542850 [Lentinula raphanica]
MQSSFPSNNHSRLPKMDRSSLLVPARLDRPLTKETKALKNRPASISHPTNTRHHSPSSSEDGVFSRLSKAFRRSSFDKRHSAYERPSSGQLMKPINDLSTVDLDPNTRLKHAKRTTAVKFEDHGRSSRLSATHSMNAMMNTSGLPNPEFLSNNSFRAPLKIRDYSYATTDPRHHGLGEDGRGTLNIPRENRVRVIFKLLLDDAEYQAWKTTAINADQDVPDSDDDTDVDDDEDGEDEDEDDAEADNEGWDGHWTVPSDEPVYDDDEEDSNPLSPGLYRALYPFIPEDPREMPLEEEQVVRVIGRGGGSGWALVVVDGVDDKGKRRTSQKDKQLALVPESYLEPISLDEE